MPEIKIGTILKTTLKAKKLSLKEVSQKTLIPYSTLYTWYENRQPKDITKAQTLANYLGISLHYLLFGEEEKFQGDKSPLKFTEEVFKGTFEIIVKKLN